MFKTESRQMKKILGIIGSPRNLGNSEILIKEISNTISTPHSLSLLRVADFNLTSCIGCYKCLRMKKCSLDDDFNMILEAVLEADAYILAVPTYSLSANISVRKLTDRALAFGANHDLLWKKPAVGIGVAGIEGKEGYTLLNIENFMQVIYAENKMTEIIYSALPGEVLLDGKHKETIIDLSQSLFGEPEKKTDPVCNLCGGKTFRFIDDKKVMCMLCSNKGVVNIENGKTEIFIEASGPEFFLTKEATESHGKWLLGMKSKFMDYKRELKKITTPYIDVGEWIRPVKQ